MKPGGNRVSLTEGPIGPAGADGAVILDGRAQHQILLELFTEHGTGTLIRPD